jgi:hypothetical protein
MTLLAGVDFLERGHANGFNAGYRRLDSFTNVLTLHHPSFETATGALFLTTKSIRVAYRMMSSHNDDDPFLQVQA